MARLKTIPYDINVLFEEYRRSPSSGTLDGVIAAGGGFGTPFCHEVRLRL
jgi:hypothetical protein